MAISRKRALERAEDVLAVPRSKMSIRLFHGKGGLTLRYNRRVIAKTPSSRPGRHLAPFVAEALGAPLPPRGSSCTATVSSGVLWRAVSISGLDLRRPESLVLLRRLLEEAHDLRGASEMAP